MSKYLDLAKRVVEAAAAPGRDVEVYISRDRELTIQMSRGQVEKLSQSGSHGMGVRVIQDGKVGYAYTSDLSEESIERTWRAAVELSEVATPDEYRALPDPEPIPDEDLQIYDPQ
ncbi:MAG: TldD/PmbA family protein, partial [Chloroflexi bacterium]